MGRPKKVTTTVVEDDELPENNAEKSDDQLDQDVMRWQVWRVSNPNAGFCFELSSAELSVDRVSKDAGPGKYKIKGIKHSGEYFRSTTISVAAPLKHETPQMIAPASPDMSLISLMMQQAQSAATQQTAVLTALIAKPESAFPWTALLPVAPMLLKELRDYFKKENQDDLAMERVLKLVTVAEKLRGNGGDDKSSWADIIRDGLSGVSQMVAARSQSHNGTGQAVVTQRAPDAHRISAQPSVGEGAVSDSVETPEAVEPTIEMLGQQWMQQKIDQLIQAASANRNPELQGELFCDELPKYIPESLVVTMLNADNWFGQLCLIDARAQNYPQWFEELRESILSTLQPDGDAADDVKE